MRFEEKKIVFCYSEPRLFFTLEPSSDGQLEISKHKWTAEIRCQNQIKPIYRPLKLELKSIIFILLVKNDSNSLIAQKLIDVTV